MNDVPFSLPKRTVCMYVCLRDKRAWQSLQYRSQRRCGSPRVGLEEWRTERVPVTLCCTSYQPEVLLTQVIKNLWCQVTRTLSPTRTIAASHWPHLSVAPSDWLRPSPPHVPRPLPRTQKKVGPHLYLSKQVTLSHSEALVNQ